MSKLDIKEFLRTPKGKLCAALFCMLLSWIFLFLNFSSSLDLALPDAGKKNKLRQEIRKLRAELKSREEALQKNKILKEQFKEMIRNCWIPSRDGDPELVLRQTIESAAKKNELKLNTLGTVRLSRINSDFAYAELDISTHAPLEVIVKFISTIQDNKPAIAWKRLTVYSIIRRRRPGNNQSRTVTGSNSENALIFSASFRVIVYDKPLPAKEIPPQDAPKTSGRKTEQKAGTVTTPVPAEKGSRQQKGGKKS